MRFKFRLWHLFALIALVATVVWIGRNAGVTGMFSTRSGSAHFWVYWDGERIWHFKIGR